MRGTLTRCLGMVVLLAALVAAALVAAPGAGRASGQATAAVGRLPSDVDKLIALASAGSGQEAFEATLRLRSVGDERAVTALEKVLAEDLRQGNTRVHGYAAAQALFCIGTPAAHGVLARHLLRGEYRADMGIDYGFRWEMAPDRRDAFIEQYHLKSTTNALTLRLQVRWAEDEHKRRGVQAEVLLCNTSDAPLRVWDPPAALGRLLLFRSAAGRFAGRCQTCDDKVTPGSDPTRCCRRARSARTNWMRG